jgi:hypothetical protein
MLHSIDELCRLTEFYTAATGTSTARLSVKLAGNYMLLPRMLRGNMPAIQTAQLLSDWFEVNWPEQAVWPHDVPRLRDLDPSIATRLAPDPNWVPGPRIGRGRPPPKDRLSGGVNGTVG